MKRRYAVTGALAFLFGVGAFIAAGPWNGDPPASEVRLPASQLREDFDLLHSLIADGVPTYGVFQERSRLDRLFGETRSRLDRSMTSVEFWKVIAPAVTAVGDGHLSLSPSPNTFTDPPFNRMIPLSVRYVGNRLFVRRNVSDQDIPEGSQILSVNGYTPEQVLRKCSSYISHLPAIVTRVRERVGRLFSEQCGLAIGLSPPYRISFRRQSGTATKPSEAILQGIASDDFGSAYARKYPQEAAAQPIELTFHREAAVLAVRTFEDGDGFDFKKELQAAFSSIAAARTRNLILDLRDNPGGPDTNGALLYSLLTNRPFRYVEKRDISSGFRKVIWHSSDRPLLLMELMVSKKRNDRGGYRLDEPIDRIWQPHGSAFTGRLFALVNGASFSTASNVASIIRKYRRGLILGEETGSGYQEDSGATFDVTLPNSGLVAVLPIVRYRLTESTTAPLRGVIPDVTVHPQPSDVVGQSDTTLSAALARARGE